MAKESYSYNQRTKQKVRHNILKHSIETLTSYREDASCVKRDYVRKVYDYFTDTEDISKNMQEAQEIEKNYIVNWESLHDSFVGTKSVRDLTICYLCGPEPNNDFQELLDMGVLPQNIWAFESDKSAYDLAVATYEQGVFPQPRILKQNIDSFFKYTPKCFDIVYIDACGSVPSAQHALRCLTTLCFNARLNSPGIVITNFSSPDPENEDVEEFLTLISLYSFFKEYANLTLEFENGLIVNPEYEQLYEKVKSNFKQYYGDFISSVLRDIPSVLVPIQRAKENVYVSQMVQTNSSMDLDGMLKNAQGLSLPQFFIYCEILRRKQKLSSGVEMFLKEVGQIDDIIRGFSLILALRNNCDGTRSDIQDIRNYFENDDASYQFLDKPHSNLIFDTIVNQLSYPMHFSPWRSVRYKYTAKSREMFTDVTVLDECRYIYEWLPAVHQIVSAYNNKSWQYVFRFALDGLIKSRYEMNNEFFFQGSVVPFGTDGFKEGFVTDRICIDDL